MASSSIAELPWRRNKRRNDFIPGHHVEPPFKFDFSKSLLELCGIGPIEKETVLENASAVCNKAPRDISMQKIARENQQETQQPLKPASSEKKPTAPMKKRHANMKTTEFIPGLHKEPPFEFDFSKSLLELCGIQPIGPLPIVESVREELVQPSQVGLFLVELPAPQPAPQDNEKTVYVEKSDVVGLENEETMTYEQFGSQPFVASTPHVPMKRLSEIGETPSSRLSKSRRTLSLCETPRTLFTHDDETPALTSSLHQQPLEPLLESRAKLVPERLFRTPLLKVIEEEEPEPMDVDATIQSLSAPIKEDTFYEPMEIDPTMIEATPKAVRIPPSMAVLPDTKAANPSPPKIDPVEEEPSFLDATIIDDVTILEESTSASQKLKTPSRPITYGVNPDSDVSFASIVSVSCEANQNAFDEQLNVRPEMKEDQPQLPKPVDHPFGKRRTVVSFKTPGREQRRISEVTDLYGESIEFSVLETDSGILGDVSSNDSLIRTSRTRKINIANNSPSVVELGEVEEDKSKTANSKFLKVPVSSVAEEAAFTIAPVEIEPTQEKLLDKNSFTVLELEEVKMVQEIKPKKTDLKPVKDTEEAVSPVPAVQKKVFIGSPEVESIKSDLKKTDMTKPKQVEAKEAELQSYREISYADQTILTSALAVSLNNTTMDVTKLKTGWNRRKQKIEKGKTIKQPEAVKDPKPEALKDVHTAMDREPSKKPENVKEHQAPKEPEGFQKPKKKAVKRKSMAVDRFAAKGKMFTTGSPLRKRQAPKTKTPIASKPLIEVIHPQEPKQTERKLPKARMAEPPELLCPKAVRPPEPKVTEQTVRKGTRTRVSTLSRRLGQRVEYVYDEDGLPTVKNSRSRTHN
ncbi:hypothetical protein L596_000231 [Steinernema carpocapsae]|uniref:Uncharacterized protein n=1 Tax=Steinernema carpocapsae TaxID=34508 RepID=A0A4U8UJZ3_STECR|nr:hypothetical protein L596_000231 [Steinernema carpocapsae]